MIGRRNNLQVIIALVISLVLTLAGSAQDKQPAPPTTKPQSQDKLPEGKVPISPEPEGPAPEHHLTKAEADELFKSIDDILAFVSKDTGLPIKHPVKRQLATREFVVKYLEQRMKEDEDQIRLEQSEASLKKFRLLPKDFNLRPFLLEMLKEQVAGFYDPKTETMYLLDWVEPEAQKTVLAHELTHALQDQNFGMEKWMEAGGKTKDIQKDMERDEKRSAREAVLEGQGMIGMIDYMMAPQGVKVTDAPQLVEAMRAGMDSAQPNSPTFSKAPLFLREILVFPYSDGMNFEMKVLLKEGAHGGFAGVLNDPPTTTRNVMEPQTYLAKEEQPQIRVANVDDLLGKAWQRWDYGYMGEYDVWLLMKQWFKNNGAAEDISHAWRGGYYLSYRKNDRKAPADSRIGPEELAMTYISKWTTPEKARTFAKLYSDATATRYEKALVTKELGDGNRAEWSTEEGPVIIEVKGDTVFVNESFDVATAGKLRDAEMAAWK